VRVASLGSGSKGNGTLIEEGDTCLLVDLGFSIKETLVRLERLSKTPTDIDAILVTHEHADHLNGVASFAKKYDIPVRMTAGTSWGANCAVTRINCQQPFAIGHIYVQPVPVPHDAREPSQFVFTGQHHERVGLLTDIGHITPYVQEQYSSCDVLLLECNYDRQMLENGSYPHRLKQRVSGIQGHLSNDQAAQLLGSVQSERLAHLVLSHISEKNNLPSLATAVARDALGNWQGDLQVSDQQLGTQWIECPRNT
jgi:phosphoribosyl 1,2-cyclic phosphodiesterase|tara:strand:- start:390 stop:1151 length:762 start_codon:yes stop_codon:yes gene_type:complete